MTNRPPYIIDANILILFNDYTPENIHKAFWRQLAEVVVEGKIIIIRDVADECKYGDVSNYLFPVVIGVSVGNHLTYFIQCVYYTYMRKECVYEKGMCI